MPPIYFHEEFTQSNSVTLLFVSIVFFMEIKRRPYFRSAPRIILLLIAPFSAFTKGNILEVSDHVKFFCVQVSFVQVILQSLTMAFS